ncbi:MAG TPA: MFS transporter [Opitutaceae bacterium]|nr:MFS transporter [Opitutaceae bacterium]
MSHPAPDATAAPPAPREAARLAEISPQQWKSGVAAWLGWLFDGLELHLYTLVATPLVVLLLGAASANDPAVKEKSAYIQAAFLIGWALGGAFFGRLGDLLGRSRALALTVLTYALCTGLCALSQTWWQLMLFRFVAALGIGGEWAVGASLLTETWPRAWRPWLAAVLQTGVNLGVLGGAAIVAFLAPRLPLHGERYVFLVGIVPALLVFWIRRHVPEPETWQRAEQSVHHRNPRARELFGPRIRSTTLRTTLVCALALSAWWLFLFWQSLHLRQLLTDAGTEPGRITQTVSWSFFAVNAWAIGGNFAAGWLARDWDNRRAIALFLLGLGASIVGAFIVPHSTSALAWFWLPLVGFFSGVFGLFTMYLPPLFPTLLRTTGAGFCYNIGRTAAAIASVIFGWLAPVGDFRRALLWAGALAFAAALSALWLPTRTHEDEAT